MTHLGEIVLMIALGVTFAQFGAIGRGDEIRGPETRRDSHRDQAPSPRWAMAAFAGGAALLSGLGLDHAAVLAAAVAVAALLASARHP